MTLTESLQEILGRYLKPARPLDSPHDLGNSGGMSGANLWRYRSELGMLVLRAWPAEFRDRMRLERIDRWLARASDLPFMPSPIACDDGSTVVEHANRLWQLSPWVSGRPDLSEPPDADHVEAAFRGLATMHLRWANGPDSRAGASPGMVRRLKEIEDLLRGGFDRLERRILESPQDTLRDVAIQWVRIARRVAPAILDPAKQASRCMTRLQPCIRDTRRDHFLFEGSKLTGIVDFGAMDVDSVAGDIARLMGDWLAGDRHGTLRVRGIGAYEMIRGLDPTEKQLATIFERANGLLIPGHWVRWHYVEGRRFEDPAAVSRGLGRGMDRLMQLDARLSFGPS